MRPGQLGAQRCGEALRGRRGFVTGVHSPRCGFVTQCVTNRKGQVERPHVLEIGCREALAEVGGEPLRQVVQHRLAVRGALPAALFVLDDQPPDLPVGLDHRRVDRAVGRGPRRLQDRTDITVKSLLGHGEGARLPRHQTPSISNIRLWRTDSSRSCRRTLSAARRTRVLR